MFVGEAVVSFQMATVTSRFARTMNDEYRSPMTNLRRAANLKDSPPDKNNLLALIPAHSSIPCHLDVGFSIPCRSQQNFATMPPGKKSGKALMREEGLSPGELDCAHRS
jgi:hypothetical protein